MNLEQRAAKTVGPWWKALAEEPAHSRSASEWGEVAMCPLKLSLAVAALALAFGFAFHSEFALVMAADGTELYSLVEGVLGVALWLTAGSGVVLAAKAGISKYREEN